MLTTTDLARIVLAEALAARVRERISLTVTPRQVEVVVYDPERDRRIGSARVEETGYRLHDHKIVLEVRHGVLRVVYPDLARASKARPSFQFEERTVDDLDPEIVAGMVRRAVEAGRTPF